MAELNAEVSPPWLASAVSPASPAVLSQARKVRVAVPPSGISPGTNLILWVSSSRRASPDMSTVPPVSSLKADQVSPSSTEYCHIPSVLSTAVTARASGTVSSSAVSASVTEPSTMISETLFPPFSRSSPMISESAGDWVSSSFGA